MDALCAYYHAVVVLFTYLSTSLLLFSFLCNTMGLTGALQYLLSRPGAEWFSKWPDKIESACHVVDVAAMIGRKVHLHRR
jgi:hypothetical protein